MAQSASYSEKIYSITGLAKGDCGPVHALTANLCAFTLAYIFLCCFKNYNWRNPLFLKV